MEKYKILKTIDYPDDIKKLNLSQLKELSNDVSLYIHEVISKIGGHYSSPLGVVDLTVALHYVYDSPDDKIIWDVGHQCYAHKILTGRKHLFKNIRQYKGISGFLRIDESEYDNFGAGHASTSISSALGFAHARDKMNQNNQIVSIIGDGALTGGMAYEGLNNLGYHRTQLTVILNDNSFSISKSVGALSKYLTRINTNPTYNKLRNEIWNISNKIPVISKQIQGFLRKTEGTVKSYLTPGLFFEELGLRYIGPIDGHDIDNMIKVFNSVKEMNTPVLLHIFTDKSKGYLQNNHDAVKSYSISPESKKQNNELSYSNILGKILYDLAPEFQFNCITAAMEIGTGLSKFAKNYPDRYIDVGIAEEHAVTYAAGTSAAGILPIIPIYSTFMQRAYDQIIHDVSLQRLPAIFCMDRAGIVGNDGPTHNGIFDIAFMRTIPNMIVSAPKDGYEMYDLLYTAIKNKLIFSIRYPKESIVFNDNYKPKELKVGSWNVIVKGEQLCILTYGSMLKNSIDAAHELQKKYKINVGVVNCRFIKPIDEELLDLLIKNYKSFLVVEESIIAGGFGSSILEYFSSNSINKNVKLMGIEDKFTEQGSRHEILNLLGLNKDSIVRKVLKSYEK